MIRLRGVSKQFDGKRRVTALDGVELEIPRGEMASIVGPSGSGKSTLLNLIGGLDRATAGDVEIDGEALARLTDDALTRVRRDKIGFSPPQESWMNAPAFRERIGEVLLDDAARRRGLYDPAAIEADLGQGRWRDHGGIWRAFNAELWLRATEDRGSRRLAVPAEVG